MTRQQTKRSGAGFMGLIFGFIGSNTVLVITMIGDWDPSD
jgi:hypothetical protein